MSDSGHFCVRSHDGRFQVYSPSGSPVYTAILKEMTDIVVTPDGRSAMAYSSLDPNDPTVLFLDQTGRVCWQTQLKGAVWCASACVRKDGARFIAGTGERYVYVIDIGHTTRRYYRWRTPGAVVSVASDANGEALTYGTWQESSVCRAAITGKTIWRLPADPARLQYIEPLHARGLLVLRSQPVQKESDGSYNLLDRRGMRGSGGAITASEAAHVMVSPDGRFLCTGSRRSIEHKGKCIYERHAVLTDAAGAQFWEKGSSFFEAVPMLVTSNGYVLLNDGDRSLFVVSPNGRLQPSVKLPGRIKSWVGSRDGSRLLITCAGGRLYLIRIS